MPGSSGRPSATPRTWSRRKPVCNRNWQCWWRLTQNCIAENARITQDQVEYQKRYNGLVERYEKAKARV